MEDQCDESRVVVQVTQLALDVPVVDVDGDGPQLERCEHAFDVLRTVDQLQADRVTRTDARTGQMIGEAVGTLVDLPVGEPPVADDEDLAVRVCVGHRLVEGSEGEGHCLASSRARHTAARDDRATVRRYVATISGVTPLVSQQNDNPVSGSAHAICPPIPPAPKVRGPFVLPKSRIAPLPSSPATVTPSVRFADTPRSGSTYVVRT